MNTSQSVSIVDLRRQVIDNACVLYPNVPIDNFRIITREMRGRDNSPYYHAYLIDIEIADDDQRLVNRMLLNTLSAGRPLPDPATAYAFLLLITSSFINRWIAANPDAME